MRAGVRARELGLYARFPRFLDLHRRQFHLCLLCCGRIGLENLYRENTVYRRGGRMNISVRRCPWPRMKRRITTTAGLMVGRT